MKYTLLLLLILLVGACSNEADTSSTMQVLTDSTNTNQNIDVSLAFLPAKDGNLSPQDVVTLKDLVFPILVPSRLPSGSKAFPIKASYQPKQSTYVLTYVLPNGACFQIEGSEEGGFGGEQPKDSFPAKVSLGQDSKTVPVYVTQETVEGNLYPNSIYTEFFTKGKGFYRLLSGEITESPNCNKISESTAKAILANLGYLAGTEILQVMEEERSPTDVTAYNIVSMYNKPQLSAGDDFKVVTSKMVRNWLGVRQIYPSFEGEDGIKESIETFHTNSDTTFVLITHMGGGDDSVAGTRYLAQFLAKSTNPALLFFGEQYLCHPGRGSQVWSTRRCN